MESGCNMASGTTLNARNSVALGPKGLARLLLQVSEGKSLVRRVLQRLRFRGRRSRKADCGTSGSFCGAKRRTESANMCHRHPVDLRRSLDSIISRIGGDRAMEVER